MEIVELVAPAAGLVLLFVGGFVIYLVKTRMAGCSDTEMRERGASLILGPFLRDYFAWLMTPVLRLVVSSGVPATFVTCLALVFAMASGVAIGAGHFALGGWLFLGSGLCDFLDGRVARLLGQTSKSGAVLDSVFDRYGEGAVFIGLAWFYRESWILLVVLIAALGSQLVSYTRARCHNESVDVSRIGLLQRPERVAIMGTTICLSPLLEALIATTASPTYHLAITGLVFVAIIGNITALQRLAGGLKVLRAQEAQQAQQARRRRLRNAPKEVHDHY